MFFRWLAVTMGLGFLLSLVNGVLRDAGQMVTFILMFWMFLTPVVYPAPKKGAKLITLLNPVSPFVVAAQDLTTNRLGSFNFNSLADLEAGRPASFTRQLSPRKRSESGS